MVVLALLQISTWTQELHWKGFYLIKCMACFTKSIHRVAMP